VGVEERSKEPAKAAGVVVIVATMRMAAIVGIMIVGMPMFVGIARVIVVIVGNARLILTLLVSMRVIAVIVVVIGLMVGMLVTMRFVRAIVRRCITFVHCRRSCCEANWLTALPSTAIVA
jgi:hypothetical protein